MRLNQIKTERRCCEILRSTDVVDQYCGKEVEDVVIIIFEIRLGNIEVQHEKCAGKCGKGRFSIPYLVHRKFTQIDMLRFCCLVKSYRPKFSQAGPWDAPGPP